MGGDLASRPRSGGRIEELRPRWVLWSGQTAAQADRRRGTAGHVLGYRRGAPAAVRRLAGRPWLGLGLAARPGHRHDAGRRTARPVRLGPVRRGRGRRQRPGGAGRAPAPGVAQRRLVGQSRTDGPVGGPGPGGRRASSRRRWPRWTAGRWPSRRPAPSPPPNCSARSCPPTGCRWTGPSRSRSWPRLIGPRPRSDADAAAQRAARDAEVLRHAPAGVTADLRSPAQVQVAAGPGRRGRAGHPGLAAAGDAGRASAGRSAARLAEGGADRHHLRLCVAGRAPGRRRQAARRLDRLGRRGRPDDRVGGPAQHAGRAAPGRHRRRGSRVRPGRPGPDRAAGAGRGVRRPRPGGGGPLRRPVRAGGGAARRGPGGGQGGGPRRDVRADHRARRPGAAPPQRGLSGGDGLPR